MTKRNLLRITGVIFSLLIIASVFLPYNSVNNNPLFSPKNSGELILSIVIILFGVVSIILYALNFYIEFPISTSGAVLFFVVIEAVYAIGNKTFSEFSTGYYLLALGAILLFINTIIMILSSKSSKKEEITVTQPEVNTVTESINNIYEGGTINEVTIKTLNNQAVVEPVQPIVEPVQSVQPVVEPVQPVQPVVEPVQSVQPIVEPVQPVQPIVEPVQSVQPIVEPVQPVVEPVQSVEPVQQLQPIQELQPIVETQNTTVAQGQMPEIQFEQMPEYKEPIKPIYDEPKEIKPEDNPALKSLLEPEQPQVAPAQPVNPVVQQFDQPQVAPVQPVNPVLQQFDQPQQSVVEPVQPVNPVLQQFDQPMSFIGQPIQQEVKTEQQQEEVGVGMNIFNNH